MRGVDAIGALGRGATFDDVPLVVTDDVAEQAIGMTSVVKVTINRRKEESAMILGILTLHKISSKFGYLAPQLILECPVARHPSSVDFFLFVLSHCCNVS